VRLKQLRNTKVLTEYYNKITTYLTQTLGASFIFFTILLTTTAAIAYLLVISYVITHMDKRYFVQKRFTAIDAIASPHLTSMSYVVKIAKIIAGVFLLVCGIVMLVLPGQGLITMLIGLSLIPFPGKNKVEQNLLSRKSVRSSLNWIRIKANKAPFIFD
jgi:hypothetical protein